MDIALTKHQGKLAAGSTKRGIAPVYGDKMYRHGIRMIDLTEPEVFSEKLDRAYSFNQKMIEAFGHNIEQKKKSIYDRYIEYGRILSPYISDISLDLFNAYKGMKMVFDNAE